MKRLPLFLSTLLLCSALSGAAQTQSEPYAGDAKIVITTDAAVGDKLKVLIDSPADAKNVWIDLNNNGVCDPGERYEYCLLYTSPSPRDGLLSRMPSSA